MLATPLDWVHRHPGLDIYLPIDASQWNRENLWYLDCFSNASAAGGSCDVPPIIDAIKRFKIQSHNDQAEFGTGAGRVVNLVTKSGTNSYHGAFWEYLRNNVFDSRNPFTDFKNNIPSAPASFRQNEFGTDLGGPVRIPKLYNGTKRPSSLLPARVGGRRKRQESAIYRLQPPS